MSTRFTLQYPITNAHGETVTEISLRRAKVKDFRQVKKQAANDADADILLVALLSGWVPEDVDELDIADWNQLQDFLQQASV